MEAPVIRAVFRQTGLAPLEALAVVSGWLLLLSGAMGHQEFLRSRFHPLEIRAVVRAVTVLRHLRVMVPAVRPAAAAEIPAASAARAGLRSQAAAVRAADQVRPQAAPGPQAVMGK